MSKQPNPPPPGDKPVRTAPPPPPPWRHWLWPVALVAMVVLYLFLPGFKTTSPAQLSYSTFIADVHAHKIKTVVFASSSNGGNTPASGQLAKGGTYTTVIPGPDTTALANQLAADGVKVEATTATPSFGSQLLSWLILLAPLIFIFWLFRRLSRGAATQMQGVLGVGRSR